jgi:Cutinase
VRVTRRQSWVLILVTAGFLALVAALIPGQAMAAPRTTEAPAAQHCNNVEFLGARGSGQPYTGKGSFGGLGPEVSHMVYIMKTDLHKKKLTYGVEANPYPAVGTGVLIPSAATVALFLMSPPLGIRQYIKDNLDKFVGSINKGVDDMIFDARHYSLLCSSSVFVFVGYSQGAMVAHTAEVALDKKSEATIFKKIAGTVLLADGYRTPKTKAHEFGTSKKGREGIVSWLVGPGRDVALPNTTASICNANDIVCDFTRDSFVNARADAKIHTQYTECDSKEQCTSQKVLNTASNWVAAAVIKRLLG